MKYQIILETPELLSDEEFLEACKSIVILPLREIFKVIEARSLEGIREEVWKQKEALKHDLIMQSQGMYPVNNIVEDAFDDLSDLFKI